MVGEGETGVTGNAMARERERERDPRGVVTPPPIMPPVPPRSGDAGAFGD
jgi:hypothetical protein